MNNIPLFEMYWDDSDIEAVTKILKSGRNWAIGEEISIFEEQLAKYFERDHAIVFNSGTSALHAILLAYDIGKSDEVIVPSFTFIATANSVKMVGAKPVFADIETECFGLDPEDVLQKITPKTKAIIPVHYAGSPCKIRELRDIAEDKNVILIEDAAESFGATVGDQKVGSFGDSAMLSFCQNKIITTGEGGSIVTDSQEIATKLKLVRSHGRTDDLSYFTSADSLDYIQLGYNFRLSNILGALGISQLRKVDKIIEMRKQKANYYTSLLEEIDNISPFLSPEDYSHVYQIYTVLIENGNRKELIDLLTKNGVGSKIYFEPIHLTKFYREQGYKEDTLPVTERISKEVLSLPMYPTISNEQISYIVSILKRFKSEK